jgi:hypothetical protein
MGKVLSFLIGIILLLAGIVMTWLRFDLVKRFAYGGIAILFLLVGLGVLFFAISEMRAGPEEPPVIEAPSPPAAPGSGESPPQAGQQ